MGRGEQAGVEAVLNETTKLKREEIIRTTVDKVGGDGIEVGIYVIAYLSRVVYVGKSMGGISARLRQHIGDPRSLLGEWLTANKDWANIRLDILVPPYDQDDKAWLRQAEVALINEFDPLLNSQIG